MAVVKFGALVTYGVGVLGGHVFQRFRSGFLIRTNYSSTGNHFYYDVETQLIFLETRFRWQSLSIADKQSWTALGQRLPITDWEGGAYRKRGISFHLKANVSKLLSGQSTVINPVTYSNLIPRPRINIVEISVTAPRFEMLFNTVYVEGTHVISARLFSNNGLLLPFNGFKYVGIYTTSFPTYPEVYIGVVREFGEIQPSKVYQFSIVEVSESGVSSSPLILNARTIS